MPLWSMHAAGLNDEVMLYVMDLVHQTLSSHAKKSEDNDACVYAHH